MIGYRMLGAGELIRKGDQYTDDGEMWHETSRIGSRVHPTQTYRRPIKIEGPEAGEGWRRLAPDEKLIDGDEIWVAPWNQWEEIRRGDRNLTDRSYRRKVEGVYVRCKCDRHGYWVGGDPYAAHREFVMHPNRSYGTMNEQGDGIKADPGTEPVMLAEIMHEDYV